MSRSWSLATVAGIYVAINTWTYFAWYHKRTLNSHFVWNDEGFFGSDTYAGGADKWGHFWGAYVVQRIIANALQAGSWDRWSSNAMAAGAILAYLTFIEFKDAYHVGYGFSVGDMIFNILGTALGMAMDAHPRLDQMFDFRLEYLPSREYWKSLTEQGIVNAGEDYSGQTYLVAFHLASLPSLRRNDAWGLLRMLDLTLAYHTDNYLPEPLDPRARRTRELSLGVALNVQYMIDWLFGTERPADYGHATLHFLSDVLGAPYTNAPVLSLKGEAGVQLRD